jgi:hypothetical protein
MAYATIPDHRRPTPVTATATVTAIDGQRARIFLGTTVVVTSDVVSVTPYAPGLVRVAGTSPFAGAVVVPSDLLASLEPSGTWTVAA